MTDVRLSDAGNPSLNLLCDTDLTLTLDREDEQCDALLISVWEFSVFLFLSGGLNATLNYELSCVLRGLTVSKLFLALCDSNSLFMCILQPSAQILVC